VENNPGPAAACVTGVLNCRSASHEIPVIHDLITDRNLDVLLLSETWFTSDTPQSILLDVAPVGYAALHVVRQTGSDKPKRGGGLAAEFRESNPVRVHHLASTLAPRTFELQLLRVGTGSGSCTSFSIVRIYRPPWMSSVSNFLDKLADIIVMLTTDSCGDIIACGDLNCPGPDESSVDVELTECFESLGLTQLVDEPTRRLPNVANLLDVLVTNNAKLVSSVRVDNADCLSDHCLITADIAARAPKPVVSFTLRNIRAVDAVSFEADLRSSVLFTQPADKLNAYVDQLNDTLIELLNRVAPVRSRRRRSQKPISKWLSIKAVAAKRSRRRLKRRWRTTGTEADRSEYRKACRKANQLINESRSAYYRQRIHEAGSNYKRCWKLLNDLLHSHDTDKTRTEDENRYLCTAFSNFFL